MTACINRLEIVFMAEKQNEVSFAKWLSGARLRSGLSQEDLADSALISQEYLSLLERGNRNPSRKVVIKLIGALAQSGNTYELDDLTTEGLSAAGFLPSVPPTNYADPLETISREIGYDLEDFSDEEKRRMRAGLDSLVIGFVEKERRERQKQNQRK